MLNLKGIWILTKILIDKNLSDDEVYIVVIPFIDTKKLHRLNIFYNSNKIIDGRIDIVTLKENRKKINEIINEKISIVEVNKIL